MKKQITLFIALFAVIAGISTKSNSMAALFAKRLSPTMITKVAPILSARFSSVAILKEALSPEYRGTPESKRAIKSVGDIGIFRIEQAIEVIKENDSSIDYFIPSLRKTIKIIETLSEELAK